VVHFDFGLGARAMEVQIRIEVFGMEVLDALGMVGPNMAVQVAEKVAVTDRARPSAAKAPLS
jgi:hypothetical protein